MPKKQPRTNSAATPPAIDCPFACFRMQAQRSKIHRWGVYAGEDIPANRKVIEYTGERISRRETKIRAARPLNYIFTLDSYWALDGSVGGSGASLSIIAAIRISSRACCGAIFCTSVKRPIKKGEELTVDYHFSADEEFVKCVCGAKNCSGSINLK